ncbi:MAG: tRNA guanosine(34) transglycosylase Tgt [Rectinema subterraneum]|uniref:tRNA guanosine(34) transglycosylase Tgt n=1 Tax=Rectinema subterraneum TaxID=2653714 RepID=UPI003C7E1FEC
MANSIFIEKHRDPSCRARTGTLFLPHGEVETPAFMPVGTNATVKAVEPADLDAMGFNIILANTYHLFLRPGPDIIAKAGGLHGFSGWKKNFLTDSGGFQVFSLSQFRKILQEGVHFKSHIDGSSHVLTPEKVVDVQVAFNSDIQMALDICAPWGETEKKAFRAAMLTYDWAKRAKSQWIMHRENGYQGNLFGIVQGNFYEELRKLSAEQISELDLPGIAIGGLSIGEPKEAYIEYLELTSALLPLDKPHYLMGIGTPDYIIEAVRNGIDIFDCVYPTRTARNGLLFTSKGQITIKKAIFKEDFSPIDPECSCHVCKTYSRAYLHHLFRNNEILYSMLASQHNLHFMADFVGKIRKAIEQDRFEAFARAFMSGYSEAAAAE